VTIQISEEKGVRYLHFGSEWVQGAMRVARPWALELEYTRELMLPLLFREADWPRSVLQVGLGAASVTKFLYRHRPGASITVVEIEPEVVTAAQQFFKLPADKRISVQIADGYDYLMGTLRAFDLIVVDGFDDKARPGMLDSIPFYVNCRAHLAPDGILAVNLVQRRRGVAASVERLRHAFEERLLVLPPNADGNVVALGAAGGSRVHATIEELRRAANSLRQDTGLNLAPSVARLAASKARTRGVDF
jgi:spermidine synthase